MNRRVAGIAALVVVLVAGPVLWATTDLSTHVIAGLDRVHALGPWGPVLFALAYALSAAFAFPASFGQLAAGFLFGPVLGTAVAWAGAFSGALLDFALGRYVLGRRTLGGWVESDLFLALEDRLASEGTTWVLLLRLSPVTPYHVVSFALGTTRVSWRDFAIGTGVGVVSPCVLYGLTGAGLTELAGLAEGASLSGPALGIALALTLVVTVVVTQRVRAMFRDLAAGAVTPPSR